MVERTQQVLSELHDLIASARAVPMSASCMISRGDALALIEKANAALADDLTEAQRITATSLETLERAQEEARQIVAAAEEKASYLATTDPVHEEARHKAALLEAKAVADAEALRREADTYVDARIAAFEASLQKTLTQMHVMRERLSTRSALDDDTGTHALPRLDG